MRVASRHGAWSEIGSYRQDILEYVEAGNHVEESGNWNLPSAVEKEVHWIGLYVENRKVNERLSAALGDTSAQATLNESGDLVFQAVPVVGAAVSARAR